MSGKLHLIALIIAGITSYSTAFCQVPNWQWAKSVGGSGWDYSYAVAVDNSGSTYTTGQFSGTADFDPGPGSYNLASAGDYDIFIYKLNPQGNFIWAKKMGGSNAEKPFSIAVDDSGNVYTTGTFSGMVDFDPGTGSYFLTSSSSVNDIYISKLDSSGNFVWAKKFGSSNSDRPTSIFVDHWHNVYSTGVFTGTADFDPGSGTFSMTPSGGGMDIYISKLNANGNFIWAKMLAGSYSEFANSLIADTSGDIFIGGYFNLTCDFDPGAGIYNLTSTGDEDAFIAKLDSSGNFVWARQIGGVSTDRIASIDLDRQLNIYATGYFYNTSDFDPGPSIYNLTSSGSQDIFVVKIDSAGNFLWANQAGGPGNDFGTSIKAGSAGQVYCTGSFTDTVDFDPDTGTCMLMTFGAWDIFILGLHANGDLLAALQLGGISNDNGTCIAMDHLNNIYATGDFMDTADFDPGPGYYPLYARLSDISTFKLCVPSNSVISKNSCNSFTSPSGNYTWTSSGTYYDTIPNVSGCDSSIIINLVISNVSTSSVIVESACDSYDSPSGNYMWDSSGIYIDTVPNASQCDSIITIHLTVLSVDTSVVQNGGTLISGAAGATWQWLDCNNGYISLAGETDSIFLIPTNGSYAVSITQNGCTDTSACNVVTGVGIVSVTKEKNLQVYPNPSLTGQFFIVGLNGNEEITITNPMGQLIYRKSNIPDHLALQLDHPGIYFIQSLSPEDRIIIKLVVN